MINTDINIKSFNSSIELKKALLSIDFQKNSIVVSGVKDKNDLQLYFLNQQELPMFGNSIQTFYEFLEGVLFQVNPNIKIVSSHYIKAMIAKEEKSPETSDSIFEFLKLMLPALSHPDGVRIMYEWLQAQKTSVRWGELFNKASKIYSHILNQNITTQEFIPALLFNLDLTNIKTKKMYFHLSSNLKPIHIHILNSLAKKNDLTLLCPSKNWIDEYEALKAYKEFKISNTFELPKLKSKARRLNSMLSEVKDAVVYVRKWITSGVEQKNIAIVAPDIELYWKVLKEHLDVEGIGYDRAVKTPIQSFPDVARLISLIRANLIPSKHDLQLAIFHKDKPIVSYDTFYEKYDVVTKLDDYKRSETISKFISNEFNKTNLGLDEFIKYISIIWKKINGDADRLAKIIGCIVQDNFTYKMDLLKWLYYLERLLIDVKITKTPANLNGISILDLSDLDKLDTKKIYLIGTTYQAMNDFRSVPITKQDLDNIEKDTGFVLDHKFKNLEFNANWMLSSGVDAVISFAENSFFSDEQTPSYFWLKHAKSKSKNRSEKTRWDFIQEKIATDPQPNRSYDNYLIKKTLKTYDLKKLSATSIETFKQCPFVFYAKQCLGLSEKTALGLDMSYLYQGSFLHECLEDLIKEPFKNYSKQELEKYLKNKIKSKIIEPKYIDKFMHKYARILERVFEFELQIREEKKIKTKGKEVEFKTYYLLGKNKFSKESDDKKVLITGKIDRIDMVNDKELRIVDYKRSGNQIKHHSHWIKNNLLQLILYSILVEENVIDTISGQVSEAWYFNLKDINLKGFCLSNKTTRQGKISPEDLHKLYEDFKDILKATVGEIENAQFDPAPSDPKKCKDCWLNKTCRYNYEV